MSIVSNSVSNRPTRTYSGIKNLSHATFAIVNATFQQSSFYNGAATIFAKHASKIIITTW